MDSNSISYLILGVTVGFFTLSIALLSGVKRKPKEEQSLPAEIPAFELRTTHFSQLLIYIWIPLIVSVPVLIFKEINLTSYFVLILILMIVGLSWFIAAQHTLRREYDDEE